jgi:hypothetical protein
MMCSPVADLDSGGADKPSGERRVMHTLGAVLVAVVLPAVLIGALVGKLGLSALFVGLLLGASGSKIGGTRRMLYVAPLIGVAAGLGAYTAYDWWWVALLASVGVLAGAGIRFGWLPALLMVPFAATFVTPVSAVKDAAIYGVIVAIAGVYGIVVARRFGASEVVDGDASTRRSPQWWRSCRRRAGRQRGDRRGAGLDRALLGRGAGAHTRALHPDGQAGADTGKAIGTALGVAAAIPVAIISAPAGVLAAVGAVAFVLALTQRETYWIMYGLYTFSLVLLLAAPGKVGFEAEERGFQILVGIGLLVVGLAIIHALGAWLAKRDPQPELAA